MESVLRELRYPFQVLFQALVLIAIVGTIVAVARSRRMPTSRAVLISVAEALLAASLAAIWAFTIVQGNVPLPGQYQPPLTPNWVPIVPVVQGLLSDEADIAAFNLVGNVGLFIPFGAALVWRFGIGPWRAVAIGLAVSASVELYQLVGASGRSVDVNDVLLNAIGMLIGAGGMSLALRRLSSLAIRPLE